MLPSLTMGGASVCGVSLVSESHSDAGNAGISLEVITVLYFEEKWKSVERKMELGSF